MQTEDFIGVLLLGMTIGTALILLIQAYGRRKVRKATNAIDVEAQKKIALLTNANDHQTGQIDRLQDRIAVLERLATDPSERTARAIEALR